MAGEFSTSASSGINFAYLAQTMGTVLSTAETNLQAKIDGLGPNPTQTDLLEMQAGLMKWSMLIQLESTVVKEYGDAMKGIIQKSA